MIERELYINWLNDRISELVANDIVIAVHDEFSYNSDANLDITVKMLPGQIQYGIPQYPCELLIEVNENFAEEVIKALTQFTLDFNESLLELGSQSYRQYYNTPNVIGTFQNRGIVNNTALSISVSLISFTRVDLLQKLSIKTQDQDEYLDVPYIDFSLSYMAETNSSGAIYGNCRATSLADSMTLGCTFTFVPKDDNEISRRIISHMFGTEPNDKYDVVFYFKKRAHRKTFIIQACGLSQNVNGLPLLQVSFMESA